MDEKENTRELVVVDVKRYKKVKAALKDSEERYRQLFENVPIGIYRTTPDGRFIDGNPALVKMTGFASFADLASLNLNNEYANSSLKRADFIKLLKRDGEVKGLEYIWRTRDGKEVHVRENAKLSNGENGEVFFEGTVEDITQSKLAEAVQKSRTEQLEIINRIISSGNTAASLDELLDSILDNVLKPLAFNMAAIFMYDPGAKKVQVSAFRGVTKSFFQNEKYRPFESMPFSQVLLCGQPVFIDNANETIPALASRRKWRMAGCIPMLSKGRVVGAIIVASCDRAAFSPEEKNILELIGKEAGTLVSKLQTEKALRESEKFYRTLIDTSPDIVAVMDLEARLLIVNQQFLSIGGYFYDDVIGVKAYDFVSDIDQILLKKKTSAFIKKMSISGSEYLFKKKDGQTIPLEVTASLFNDSQGCPKGIIAIGRDISERKRAELDNEEKNKVLAILNDISLELAFLPPAVDMNGYISSKMMSITNAVYVGVNRYNKDTRQLEFIHANTENKIVNKISNILGAKIETFKYDVSEAMYEEMTSEVVGYRKTLYEASFGAIPETTGSIIQRLFKIDHFIGMALVLERELIGTVIMAIVKGTPAISFELIKSISHILSVSLRRRQAEYQLAASEEKFKNLFYISPDSIILSRLDNGNIVSVNKGFTKIMNYKESEVVGKTIMGINIFKTPKDCNGIVAALKTKGVVENNEYEFIDKSGNNIFGLVSAVVIEINGEKYIMITIRDISERKQDEVRLLAYQEQLRALTSEMVLVEERERRRIAAELHDQIGQNLALCKLKVAALEKNPNHDAVKNELAVVRRLLECSIQDARSLIFDLSPPVLYELGFAAALEWLAERMQEQFHIAVEFESRFKDPALQNDQQVILFQVVRELLMNVGKHAQASQAKVILMQEGALLKIQVTDNGVGFDSSKIFAPKEQGSGFGFFSMRERLNYLGGKLEVKSGPGLGTRVILTVPLPAQPFGRRPPVGLPAQSFGRRPSVGQPEGVVVSKKKEKS